VGAIGLEPMTSCVWSTRS